MITTTAYKTNPRDVEATANNFVPLFFALGMENLPTIYGYMKWMIISTLLTRPKGVWFISRATRQTKVASCHSDKRPI